MICGDCKMFQTLLISMIAGNVREYANTANHMFDGCTRGDGITHGTF